MEAIHSLLVMYIYKDKGNLRAYLYGGGGPQVGEVTRGGLLHLSYECDQIKNERLYAQGGYPIYLGSPTSM